MTNASRPGNKIITLLLHLEYREVAAVKNAVWSEQPKNLEYHPEFLGDIPKNSQTSLNFNIITLFLLENSQCAQYSQQNLQIPRRILFFLQNSLLCIDPHQFPQSGYKEVQVR